MKLNGFYRRLAVLKLNYYQIQESQRINHENIIKHMIQMMSKEKERGKQQFDNQVERKK